MELQKCKICGALGCSRHNFAVGKAREIGKTEFSGSSPPEIFVGKWNYPNVYVGILSPEVHGETKILSSHEMWHEGNVQIPEIMSYRSQLILSRTQSHIKKLQTRFHDILNQVAMAHKPVSAEYKLEKPAKKQQSGDVRTSHMPLIANAAPVKSVLLQENPKIKPKVDYLVNDTSAKAKSAVLELEKAEIETSSIVKILSAGLLGLKKNRKLVPTRWSITAVDDMISKNKLEKIRYFPEISEFLVFNAEYLGNHYEFLLLPDKFSFEVIEIAVASKGSWQDYEGFSPRKNYASSVTGAYYANRLALSEYLERIGKQAQCIVIREVRPEYNAPCGVGILRETSREAFGKAPERFSTLKEAFEKIQSRLVMPLENWISKSWLLKNYKKQQRLNVFFR